MLILNNTRTKLAVAACSLLGAVSFNTNAATASFDPATTMLDLPVVEVLNGKNSTFYNAKLKLVKATVP